MDAVGQTGLPHPVPQFPAPGTVGKEQLEAALPAPPRPADHQRDSVQVGLDEGEEREVACPFADQISHGVIGPGALDGQRRDVGLEHRAVQAPLDSHRPGPQLQVPIGNGEPEPVVGETEGDRIVDQGPVVITDRRVPGPTDRAGGHVPGRQVLDECRGVGSDHFDLAFTGHIPDRHPLGERLVFSVRVAIGGGHEHVVVGRKLGHPMGHRGCEERRLPDPGPHGDPVGHGDWSSWP